MTYEEVEALLQSPSPPPPCINLPPEPLDSPFTALHPIRDFQKSAQNLEAFFTPQANATRLGFALASRSLPAASEVLQRITTSPFAQEVDISAQDITHTLRSLLALAQRRRNYRERHGCVDFSFSEARFHVQDGDATGIIDPQSQPMKVSLKWNSTNSRKNW